MRSNSQWVRQGVLVMVAGLFGGGCGHNAAPSSDIVSSGLSGAPIWLTAGCEVLRAADDSRRQVCAVGSVGGMRNHSLARNAALDRARDAIAGPLTDAVEEMLVDYRTTSVGGEALGGVEDDAQYIADISLQIAHVALSETKAVKSWVSGADSLYVLTQLHVDGFRDAVNAMEELPGELRRALIVRSDKAFRELAAIRPRETSP